MIADRVKRWARQRMEKAIGVLYEGPQPPERLHDAARAFAALHPNATVPDWAEFATTLAQGAWRDAWLRGVEHIERDPDFFRDDLPPDVVADMLTPGWRDSPPMPFPAPPQAMVPAELGDGDLLRRQLEDVVLARSRAR